MLYHDAKVSSIEAVFARGDRKLSRALAAAADEGFVFDAWDEYFSYDRWVDLFARSGLDPAFYTTRGFGLDEILPWDMIDIGVTKEFLLRERAREIMDKVNETLLLMQSANEEERYTIHLGTISSICNRVLPDKVLKLKERYPHVEFVLHEGSTTSILDMLADGTVDFGIVREPFNVGAYSSRPIRDTALGEGGQDYFTAIGKPNFFPADDTQIVALTSLQDTPIIIHRRYYDLFTNACRRQGFIPNIICQNDNIASSLSWAASGIGVAIAPYTSAIQNSDPTLVMKRIDSPEIVSKAHLIWNRSATLTPEQKAFVHLFD